jgi:hypothetical protein
MLGVECIHLKLIMAVMKKNAPWTMHITNRKGKGVSEVSLIGVQTTYTQGGQPCRQSPHVANWPWKCGNLSDKRIVKFRIKFSNFLINHFVSLFSSNGSCNWVVKIYMFWKKLVQTVYFNIFLIFNSDPKFLVFTWYGEFGDRLLTLELY